MSSLLFVTADDATPFQISLSNLEVFKDFKRLLKVQGIQNARDALCYEDFDALVLCCNSIETVKKVEIKSVKKSTGADSIFDFLQEIECSCILLVEKISVDLARKLENSGIFVIERDFAPACYLDDNAVETLLIKMLKFILLKTKERQKSQREKLKLENSLQEERLVNRAKCILMQYLNMSESQAHRYIEVQSMQLRQTRLQTAESILKTYEI
ncbi:MAG: ANTAR domain-containing protein [Treponema sp.]|nr:ANTAR domain-containing protein [Treponema sp.]